MSLENLARIGQLKPHVATAQEIQRLLSAAERYLKDSGVAGLSNETRFDAAYKTVTNCAMAALNAAGYRPTTSVAGHHQTMIASLTLTVGLAKDEWLVLDAFRKKRNLNDYSGGLSTLSRCANAYHAQAPSLRRHANG